MCPHDRHHRIREPHSFQDLSSDQGVNLHFFKFFGSKPARFRDDVFGHGELSDIVQKRSRVQGFHLSRGHS